MPTAENMIVPRAMALAGALARDRSGLALLEFAFTFPIVMAMGGYGVELSYLALTNLRVSQAAVNLADSASRVGELGSGNVVQLREVDVNDVFEGTKQESAGIKLTQFGRITLSSLENVRQAQDTQRVQRIHWQRCIGVMGGGDYDSHYGTTDAADGTTIDSNSNRANEGTPKPNGMGEPGKEVKAPNDSGVMFVEINYRYQPLFGSLYVSPRVIRYTQSYLVRDNRDFTRIMPSPNASISTCDKYAA